MPSNLHNIVPAIIETLEGVTELKTVLPYPPDGQPPTPFLVFVFPTWKGIQQAMQEAAYEWTFPAYLACAATNPKEIARQVLIILPKILDAIGQNFSAGGTIADGDVMVYPGRPFCTVKIAGTKYPAIELMFRVRERYPFAWDEGD